MTEHVRRGARYRRPPPSITSLSYMDYHLADEDGAGAQQAAAGVTDRLLRQSRAVGLDPG